MIEFLSFGFDLFGVELRFFFFNYFFGFFWQIYVGRVIGRKKEFLFFSWRIWVRVQTIGFEGLDLWF